jgi:hypothetical protein
MKKTILLIMMLLCSMSVFAYGGGGGGSIARVNLRESISEGNNLYRINYKNQIQFTESIDDEYLKFVDWVNLKKSSGDIYIYAINEENAEEIYGEDDLVKLYKIERKNGQLVLRFELESGKIYRLKHQTEEGWESLRLRKVDGLYEVRLTSFSYFALVESEPTPTLSIADVQKLNQENNPGPEKIEIKEETIEEFEEETPEVYNTSGDTVILADNDEQSSNNGVMTVILIIVIVVLLTVGIYLKFIRGD